MLYYYLGGSGSRFTTDLGLGDSDRGTGAVIYKIYADGSQIYDSGVVTNSTRSTPASTCPAPSNWKVAEGNGTNAFGNVDFGNPQLACTSS